MGNRLTMVDENQAETDYTYDGNNKLTQLTDSGGTTYFDYDGNGNQVEVERGNDVWTYTYDYDNQLTGITFPDQSTASFWYDPFGRRIAKEEGGTLTNFLYDGDRVYAEYDSSWNLVARYTTEGPSYFDPLIRRRWLKPRYGGQVSMRRGEISRFYMTDQVGSVRNLTNSAQNVTDAYAYDAFGNVVASSGSTVNPYRYVGALGYYTNSSTSLLHVGARYYGPEVGRLISRDPIGYAGGLNVYRYVGNDPTDRTDPTGLIDRQGCIKKANELAPHIRNLQTHWSKYHCTKVEELLRLFEKGGKCVGFLKNLPEDSLKLIQEAKALYDSRCRGPEGDPKRFRPILIPFPCPRPAAQPSTGPAWWTYPLAGGALIVSAILIADDLTGVGALDDPLLVPVLGACALAF